jgi:hypothetical protein
MHTYREAIRGAPGADSKPVISEAACGAKRLN